MGRYLSLLSAQVRTSVLLAAQYRADFILDAAIEIVWTVTAIAPLVVVYGHRESIAGWSFGEALVVLAFFTMLTAVLEAAVVPSVQAVIEHIRKGTLDFVLLKPADAQFLVSTTRFQPWRAINVVTAIVMMVVAFRSLGRVPSVTGVLLALVLLGASITALYSLWITVVCIAFVSPKIDNVTELFGAIFDAARWPSSVFRGVVRIVLTYVIPLSLMTTVPARALLGTWSWEEVVGSIVGAAAFAVAARQVWLSSLARYTSAA
jgi:ABC-2 type transport system permease protein